MSLTNTGAGQISMNKSPGYTTPTNLTGTPLFSQLSSAAAASAMGAFSLRAVNGLSAKAVQVRQNTTDYSSAPLALTFTGSAGPSTVISSGTDGSMYLPGVLGNYLTFTDNRFIRVWTTGMTFEAWVNYTSFTNSTYVVNSFGIVNSFGSMLPAANNDDWSFGVNASGYITFYYWNGGTTSISASTNPLSINTWYHIAVQTNATTIYLYINGVLITQTAIIGTPVTPGNYFTIGQYRSGPGPNFYVGDVRLVYGGLVYATSGFTIPTAPLSIYTSGGATTALLLRTPVSDFYADRLGNLLTAPVTGQTLSSWLGGATGYVATWYDQSGKGNHMSCSSTGLQPKIDTANNWIDFKTSAYFDTSANPTAGPSPWDSTKRYTVTCHHNTIVGGICGSFDSVYGNSTNKTNNFSRNAANYKSSWYFNDQTGGTYAVGNKVSFKWDGMNRYIYGNGTLQTTTASSGWSQSSSANQYIGKNNNINGELYSIFMFNTALSDADRALVEAAS